MMATLPDRCSDPRQLRVLLPAAPRHHMTTEIFRLLQQIDKKTGISKIQCCLHPGYTTSGNQDSSDLRHCFSMLIWRQIRIHNNTHMQ